MIRSQNTGFMQSKINHVINIRRLSRRFFLCGYNPLLLAAIAMAGTV